MGAQGTVWLKAQMMTQTKLPVAMHDSIGGKVYPCRTRLKIVFLIAGYLTGKAPDAPLFVQDESTTRHTHAPPLGRGYPAEQTADVD
jgi:hypothetical protein